jgi:hypothetical protein
VQITMTGLLDDGDRFKHFRHRQNPTESRAR